jgi:methionyl-tRNA formyltransferase
MVHKAITMALERHPGYPQEGTSSAAPKFTSEFRYIDFNAPALEAHNKVRAYFGVRDHPHGALAIVDGELLCFTKTRYHAPVKVVGAPLLLLSNDEEERAAANATTSMDDILSLTTTSTDTTHPGDGGESSVTLLLPGTVLARGGGTLLIQCGDTSLEVLEWHKVE